jgi:DNA mismatch repair protein MutL
MTTIKILDSTLINKIAAGEVVERPASVLRELIENSIDAKSTKIEVYINKGGTEKIIVSDNGKGMSPEDLELAVLRHATSKIKNEEDLFNINSLGFRGEAIPSIASVSKFQIASRPHDSDIGYQITIEGGKIISKSPIAMNKGTKITVKDLFFNVPARKKFLKKENTEFSYLYDVFFKFLMIYHEKAFTFYKNDKLFKKYPSQSKEERIKALFPKEAKDLYPVNLNIEDFNIEGFISNPELSFKKSNNIYIFINGRFIKDKMLIHAVSHGYRSIIEPREYPFVIIFLKINPRLVDVNVHPQKLEVRFNDSQTVHKIISKTIENKLAETPWVKRELSNTDLNKDSDSSPHIFLKENELFNSNSHYKITEEDYFFKSPPKNDKNNLFSSDFLNRSLERKYSNSLLNNNSYFSSLKVIGQIMNTYILCEGEDGLIIIDQHAAHERIGYERLIRDYKSKKIPQENLLIPVVIKLNPEKFSIFNDNINFFNEIGFEIEIFGENTITIRKIPTILNRTDIEKFMREIIDDYLITGFSLEYDETLKKIFSTISCHSVVRGGDELNKFEMESLLKLMDEYDFSANCPHGRPVYHKISRYELDKIFHRV